MYKRQLLSSVFAKMALNVFDVPYAYQLSLSWQSMVVSFLLFLFMYGIGLARSIAVIKRTTIIRLLYDRAVSYTHLDVYKRQALYRCLKGWGPYPTLRTGSGR